MKSLASAIATGIAAALAQFSWGLLEAYGYEPNADGDAEAGSSDDARTSEQREADIRLLSCHGYL